MYVNNESTHTRYRCLKKSPGEVPCWLKGQREDLHLGDQGSFQKMMVFEVG